MNVQAIHTCACHGRVCDRCDTRVAVLQLIGDTPRQKHMNPPTYESLCQTCATAFAAKIVQYSKSTPFKTVEEIRERQGIRS